MADVVLEWQEMLRTVNGFKKLCSKGNSGYIWTLLLLLGHNLPWTFKSVGNIEHSLRFWKTKNGTTTARHIYICDYHKSLIQSVRVRQRKRKDSEDDSNETDRDTLSLQERERDTPEVDLFQLQINTLRRYKRHYKVPTRPGLNKAQLAETLMRHFRTIPVVEKEALHAFLFTVKSNKNKLDLKPNNDNL
ncbi:histone deacetylase complex subunit SAP30 homolog isoform X2 [Daphnia magna]|uniref:histone deacetylase complex subunit SAP30 homolog isoform X2 n=1 Tax=Daphnia magna TaxID=35525 RepID=UPI00140210DA|nr:histone deacetylase complex subunit SAP30 homolog isoform X2 [Daphnia magna]